MIKDHPKEAKASHCSPSPPSEYLLQRFSRLYTMTCWFYFKPGHILKGWVFHKEVAWNSFVSHKCHECYFVFHVKRETMDYNHTEKLGLMVWDLCSDGETLCLLTLSQSSSPELIQVLSFTTAEPLKTHKSQIYNWKAAAAEMSWCL